MIKLLFTTHSFHKDVLEACPEELVDSLDEFTKTWLRQVALYIPKTEAKILHGLDAALTSMLATAPTRRKKALVRLLDTIAPALAKNPVAVAPAPQAPTPVETPVEDADPLAPLPDEVEDDAWKEFDQVTEQLAKAENGVVVTQDELTEGLDPQQVMQDEFLQALENTPPPLEVAAGFTSAASTLQSSGVEKKFAQKKKPKQAYKPKLVIPKIRAQGMLAQLYRDIKKGKK